MGRLSLSKEELEADPLHVFEILEKLGEGSYGAVHKARHKRTSAICAIKIIPIENDLDESIKEISIMTDFDSQYVVQFYGSYLKDNELWIIIELCEAGSVSDIMNLCDVTMTEGQIATICLHVLRGLSYLHSKRKIHRDIKAGNILLNAGGEAKLADFGVAGQLTDATSKRQTVIGTPFWMAPEVIQEVGYGVTADIWSLGITCIEMADGRPPYHNIHPMRAIFMIPTKPPPKLENEERYTIEFRKFVARCLTKDPKLRPTAEVLLEDPFIKGNPGVESLIEIVEQAIEEKALGNFSDDDDDDDDEFLRDGNNDNEDANDKTIRSISSRRQGHRDADVSSLASDDNDQTLKVRRSTNPAAKPVSKYAEFREGGGTGSPAPYYGTRTVRAGEIAGGGSPGQWRTFTPDGDDAESLVAESLAPESLVLESPAAESESSILDYHFAAGADSKGDFNDISERPSSVTPRKAPSPPPQPQVDDYDYNETEESLASYWSHRPPSASAFSEADTIRRSMFPIAKSKKAAVDAAASADGGDSVQDQFSIVSDEDGGVEERDSAAQADRVPQSDEEVEEGASYDVSARNIDPLFHGKSQEAIPALAAVDPRLREALEDLQEKMEREIQAALAKYQRKKAPVVAAIREKGGALADASEGEVLGAKRLSQLVEGLSV